MTTEALKSTYVTNLDATPVVIATSGEGATGHLKSISGTVTATTGKTAGSTYQMVRIPTNAKVKHVYGWLDVAVTTFTVDIDIAYSSSTVDGTTPANQGTIVQVSSADNKLFGAAIALAAIVAPVDYIAGAPTAFGGAKCNTPLWSALGLANDPGGMFDLVLKNTATNSGAPVVTFMVEYVEGP